MATWAILLLCVTAITGSQDTCNGIKGLCDLPMNLVTFPGSHHSGAGANGILYHRPLIPALSCWYRHQMLSFERQFRLGIRMFDVFPCFVDEPGTGRFKQIGTWLCRDSAYGAHVDIMLDALDSVMNEPAHKNDFIVINFNKNEAPKRTLAIYNDLVERLESRWYDSENKTGVALNDYHGKTGNYPTLGDAARKNQRIFVIFPEEMLAEARKGKLTVPSWINSNKILGRTEKFIRVTPFGSCTEVVKYTRERCHAQLKKDLISVDVYGTKGMCIVDIAAKCMPYLSLAASRCHRLRTAEGQKTVNFIVVDYPEEDYQRLFLNECHRLNLDNILQWNAAL